MIPISSQSLPPLTVISSVSAIDQNTANGAGAQNTGGQQLKEGEQQFKQGQEMLAKVLSGDGQGRYVLDVGGRRVEVQSQTPLQVGQQLNVQVREGEGGLALFLKSPEAGQFLTRALATGGSSQALGMIFGQGIAAQAGGDSVLSASVGMKAGSTGANTAGVNTASGVAGLASATATATVGRVAVLPGAAPVVSSQGATPHLPTPAIAGKMAAMQHQFVQQSATPQIAHTGVMAEAGKAVQQFTAGLNNQIAPLLGQGKVVEAMGQVASGLRSLAPFFPPQPGGVTPQGLNPGQQQLYQTFSLLQQAAEGSIPVEQGDAALSRIVRQLQSQLLPALAMPGRELAGQPQNPRAMLATLNSDLLAMTNFVQLPAAFQGQPAGAPIFQNGLDGLFAFQLTQAMVGAEAATAGTTMGAGTLNSGAILQQLVQGLGLDMEQLLAKGDVQGAAKGLKFQLMRQLQEGQEQVESAMQVQRGNKSGDESGLLRQVGESHQALQSINFLQVLQANLDKQGVLALPLPLPFLEQGYLVMEERQDSSAQGGGVQNESTRFSVLMKLSSLGNVRVDFLQNKEEVYIRFHTESPQINQLFQQSQQELREGLAPLRVQGLSYASQPAADPLATLLQKCESGRRESSLFKAQI